MQSSVNLPKIAGGGPGLPFWVIDGVENGNQMKD